VDAVFGEAKLKLRSVSFSRSVRSFLALTTFAVGVVPATAQQTTVAAAAPDLTQSIRELREQIQELRDAVSEIKSEAAQYRAENQELRKELESIRKNPGAEKVMQETLPGTASTPGSSVATDQRLSSIEETTQVVQSQAQTLYQTKVESASKYRIRLSGLVLLNLFHNRGAVDNLDDPTYALSPSISGYGAASTFGATMRQSEVGLEVFGPQLLGARSSGAVNMDFGGGFPNGALDGINTGIVRLRTAAGRLDWDNTSVVAGQDALFISPNSPTSFASLLVPSLGYSGNLWAWTPQLRVEHKFNLTDDQYISLQGGILDNITGEASNGSHRLPQAGESSGQPAYAARAAWTKELDGKPLTIGTSGYYSRQNWGFERTADGWAALTDWRFPLPSRFELSGEFYRGRAVGGIGGGIGQSVLFAGTAPYARFLPVNSAGGWSQLKFVATPKIEFNGAFGIDNPFAMDIHAFPAPTGVYPSVLAANRSGMTNFIYRPRSDLLFSGEYRHLHTSHVGNIYSADQVNLMMGVLF
jgi:regulator of replication initiation timing